MYNGSSSNWPPYLKMAYAREALRSRGRFRLSEAQFLSQRKAQAVEQHALVSQRVTLLRASLKKAESEERQLHSSLEFYRRALASRCRPLPREVLGRIFQIRYNDDEQELDNPGYFPSPAQIRSALVFTRVCRLWRDVALSYPYLWQVLPDFGQSKFLSRFIAHSGSAPLMCYLAPDTSQSAVAHFGYWREVTGVRHRIRYLFIANSDEEGFVWHFKHSKVGGWHLLHTLVLSFQENPNYDALLHMFHDSSQLRTVQIAFESVETPLPPPCLHPANLSSSGWLGIPWHNIVTFVGVKISEVFLYSILLSTPRLENCDVSVTGEWRVPPLPPSTDLAPSQLSNLRSLKITNTPEGLFSRVLSHFLLPALSHFTCSLEVGWSDESLNDFPASMHRLPSLTNITCLRLDAHWLPEDCLISVLERFDLLSELILILPNVDSAFFHTLRNRNILPRLRRLCLSEMDLDAFESDPARLSVSLSQFLASRHGFIPSSDSRLGHSPVGQLEYLRLTFEDFHPILVPLVVSTFSLLHGVDSDDYDVYTEMMLKLCQVFDLDEPKKEVRGTVYVCIFQY